MRVPGEASRRDGEHDMQRVDDRVYSACELLTFPEGRHRPLCCTTLDPLRGAIGPLRLLADLLMTSSLPGGSPAILNFFEDTVTSYISLRPRHRMDAS